MTYSMKRRIRERRAEKRKGLAVNLRKRKDEKVLARKAHREKAKHIFW